MKGQVLFHDVGERHRSEEFIKTELQQFYQGIERMITNNLDGVENIVETKISNMMETIANNIVKEERTSIRNTSVKPTMKDENLRYTFLYSDRTTTIETRDGCYKQFNQKSQRENQ